MTLENEYRQKSEQATEDKTKKESKGKPAKERKSSDNALLDRLSNRFDKKRVKTILGIAMVLFSFFTFLSCFSYFFTWTSDQDRVLDVSLFSFLFDSNSEPVENWLGKFGAWMSHLFMYRWFGVSSFAISFIIFLIGFKGMLNILLLPIRRSIAVAVLFMVWSSVFLGYFVEHIDYLGGTFGFTINQWLKLTIGSFGSFIAIVALLWIVLVILFNADIMSWWNRAKGAKESFFEDDQPLAGNMTDIHVVNTIREDQIRAEQEAAEVRFDEDEEEDESYGDGEESFIVIQSGAEKEPEQELEILETIDEEEDDEESDFKVSIAKTDATLSDDEFNSIRQ